MTTSDARRDCVLYLSDVHGEFDTLSYLLGPWRDDLRWTHLIGDVYDRGPAPDKIIDMLMDYPDADIQWGNHDVVWMGAALGQEGCIAHVVRNCARYGNLDILTNSYGIDLRPLASFALSAYADDPCEAFALKSNPGLSPADLEMNVKIQKAMAILQFKVEAALIDKYPSFGLESRKLLHFIDYGARTVDVDDVTYELTDDHFPTVDPDDPYRLTEEERAVMDYLADAFRGCEKLSRHVHFLFDRGSLYKICDGDLLLHACVPLDDDGRLKEVDVYGTVCSGKKLYDEAQRWVRTAFESDDAALREKGRDLIWYLWLGPGSPLFAKSKKSTFARTRRRARRSRTPSTCYSTRQSPTSASSRTSDSTPHTPALSADMCRSRPRTVRIPSRRTDASSASTAACRRPTARRRDSRAMH